MPTLQGDIILFVPGEPIAKARPRFARQGKHVKTYSTQQTEEGRFMWEVLYQLEKLSVYKGEPFEGPLRLECRFYFKRPKAHYGTGRNAGQLKRSAPIYHVSKPDVDNAVKFVFDCLNNILYLDDRQVIGLKAEKHYVGVVGRAGVEIVVRGVE